MIAIPQTAIKEIHVERQSRPDGKDPNDVVEQAVVLIDWWMYEELVRYDWYLLCVNAKDDKPLHYAVGRSPVNQHPLYKNGSMVLMTRHIMNLEGYKRGLNVYAKNRGDTGPLYDKETRQWYFDFTVKNLYIMGIRGDRFLKVQKYLLENVEVTHKLAR